MPIRSRFALGVLLVLVGLVLVNIGQEKAQAADDEWAQYQERVSKLEPGANPELEEMPSPDPGLEAVPGAVLPFVGGCQIFLSIVAKGVMIAHREQEWLAELADRQSHSMR